MEATAFLREFFLILLLYRYRSMLYESLSFVQSILWHKWGLWDYLNERGINPVFPGIPSDFRGIISNNRGILK
ncbi:hypothetical protein UN64_11265 [Fictibacillus arsenicus]|uniref:Uncharacterized protein n=1 Tax=Fictibacillus arsenicus TaxID=255247 RepID=A0A1V3G8B3_9BACL|nr:hypothetical protein UN64_11265 [Fictibacillus arsenicus]